MGVSKWFDPITNFVWYFSEAENPGDNQRLRTPQRFCQGRVRPVHGPEALAEAAWRHGSARCSFREHDREARRRIGPVSQMDIRY